MKIDATTPRQYILRLNHHPPDYRLQIQPFTAKKQTYQLDLTNKSISDSIKKKVQLRKMSQVSSSQHYDPTNFAQSNTMSIDTKQFHIFTQKNSRANTCIQQLSYTYDPIINHQKQKKPQQPQTAFKRNPRILPRHIPLSPSIPFGPPITAQSWCIINGKDGSLLAGFNEKFKCQIASITKIMTCFLSLKFVSLISLDLDNTYFTVPEAAENVGGTSAQLQTGDQLNLRDLLYGLMLPSGNDAAVTLKHNFEQTTGINFIDEMNSCAKEFGLKSTQYMNPHGLYHKFNYSSALDIGILCFQALQNEHFANIVKTKIYFSEIIDKFGNIKEILWENTNKLLDNGFQGVKTGQTKEAGPCVVEYYLDNNNSYIIVLLNCKSTDYRWYDAIQLLDWIKQ
ncbi:unnamed protein product (macronuclear) [Paramecium tetraurelia]|uniref:Peptidase S11 D-alanyl-D-alanine carboxypeptidase A N-terminal domain-containing protein n=1 Tax=Paramecium tetraurelia TaxID=5888 RepID=A0DTC0_PARTE|nr:uncharacterized protein GSPATT00019980001 [Paramecium tetraurelia]CAK86287.1 unnamed protein product [Paramecium tetraurelia]|eukprot:XP_001453684.1 hypothetical protein (macronuclear) [Paramecium tetraurelia strain d4-2]